MSNELIDKWDKVIEAFDRVTDAIKEKAKVAFPVEEYAPVEQREPLKRIMWGIIRKGEIVGVNIEKLHAQDLGKLLWRTSDVRQVEVCEVIHGQPSDSELLDFVIKNPLLWDEEANTIECNGVTVSGTDKRALIELYHRKVRGGMMLTKSDIEEAANNKKRIES